MRNASAWRFAIDVGGTFTDVLAHDPGGDEHVLKVLSTGCFRGMAGMGSTSRVLADEQRAARRADLWAGFRLRLVATDSPSVPIVASDPDGTLHLAAPLSRLGPGAAYELSSGEPAPVAAIRRLMERRLGEALGSVDVRLGSTWGTNALLERRGASTTLAITEGFGDLLRIGYQDRPKLFELNIRKPEPLFEHVIEIGERLSATGAVLRAPDAAAVEEQLRAVRLAGARTLAVCLLHACVNDIHEQLVARIAEGVGFEHVSVSSDVAPAPRMVPRGETTVIDAYLSPIIGSYVQTLRRYLPDAHLRLMTSAGGLVSAEAFTAKDSVLSGPAGGVVGCAAVAREAGLPRVIGFDMGGTSTDVSRIDPGAPGFEYQYEAEKAGVRIVAPMLAVETVAAGGGSICRFDGQKLLVGPESAGAHPGPACYGHGGPLALTDINLVLGRLQPAHFPFPLDRRAAEQRLAHVVQEVSSATGRAMTSVEAAEGFVAIANANMADAIKKISAARGYDVREYALVSFGGAAGQHACALARRLGMRTVLSAPHAGILSAVGLSRADVMRHAERAVLVRLGAAPDNPTAWFAPLEARVRSELTAEGFDVERIEFVRSIDLRYVGQNTTLNLPIDPAGGADWSARLIDAFHAAHERTYGFRQTAREIEVVTARVAGLARIDVPPRPLRTAQERRPAPDSYQEVIFGGAPRSTPVHLRGQLAAGDIIDGPALIVDSFGTIVVEPEWVATITARLDVLLECSANGSSVQNRARERAHDDGRQPESDQERSLTVAVLNRERERAHDDAQQPESDQKRSLTVAVLNGGTPDPVRLELFHRQFASIAEQMGAALGRTALSTNVKERLDYSCAVFDSDGALVANAPHIPVHLGGMGACVRRMLEIFGALAPGDVVITNDPFEGGSHLPDVTVVTPVHLDGESVAAFFVASRAHHAEIGGIRPGSMAPDASSLAEEGVLIRPFKLFDRGESRLAALHKILTQAPYPSRRPDENLADTIAQVAANHRGAQLLVEMTTEHGVDVVRAYMRHIRAASAQKMLSALQQLPPGAHHRCESLDDGTPIAVTITLTPDGAVLDFTGSGPVHPGNLNANPAIVASAVLYCLRCLLREDIPLNDGVLAPVRLIIPPGILNPPAAPDPRQCPAVGGGNVETSQRIVDAIFGALGIVAASQGTMNNLLIGTPQFGYYETIAGGAGAGPAFDGADAVHTHMTNTRLTDPEVLESRYPLRVVRFAIRRGSGGAGRHRGGDGVIREIEFLAPAEVSILSQRRTTQPYGLAGGAPGAAGRNLLQRRDGTQIELGPLAQFLAAAGDRLTIETPGGGGYGALT